MNIPSFQAVRRMRPRLLLTLVEIVLVAALATQAARLALIIAEPGAAPVSHAAQSPADYAVLTRFDPFFRSAGEAQASPANAYRLFGVIADEDGQGSAILAGPDNRQTSVAVGEEVAPGVKLEEVAADHVVLSRAGVRSRIYFPDAQPDKVQP